MTDHHPRVHEQLLRDLAELRLTQIAATYREVLDEAARKNTSMLEVLAALVGSELAQRRQRALERRIQRAKLPPRKTLEDYNFDFPKRIPKQKILRLFDCEFVSQHRSAILIGRTGTGKTHLLNALAYTACEKGISVRWTRAIDMIHVLTDNTIVVFLSDNGPSNKGLTEDEANLRNVLGLKGGKATAWENGIRVPLLVRWPGRIKPGERKQFGSVEDVLPTLAELAGLDAAKFPQHQPWHGVSLRPVLENAAAPEIERTVFRVAIAGEDAVGGRRAFVSDPASLPMTEQHVTLRGPRFKFHQFAGGGTALFDLDADPGENQDVQERFPEIARRYAAEIKKQYRAIVRSGRALRMPVVHVGKPRPGVNAIDGVMAQRSAGKVNGTAKGARGFLQAGDCVVYDIDVQHAGNFELTIAGENLDRARGWEVRIGDIVVPPKEASAGQLSFAPAALPPGPAAVMVGVRDSADSTKDQPILSRLSFRPRP